MARKPPHPMQRVARDGMIWVARVAMFRAGDCVRCCEPILRGHRYYGLAWPVRGGVNWSEAAAHRRRLCR